MNSPLSAPDNTVAANDPGDDTARRFRFQWVWAAITCCMLLDDSEDVAEVFCEQHEDVLIKHGDGRFSGNQIKTRESDQPVWKAGDEQIKGACARFVQLEKEFGGHFRAFRLLTNHSFHSSDNAQCLAYILKQISAAPTVADLPSNVGTWLNRIADIAQAPAVIAFQAMKKTTATDSLPKLQDAMMRLVHALTASWIGAGECSHESVQRAAQALVDECARASSLDHQQALPAYVVAINQPERDLAARIDGKKMTVDRTRTVLTNALAMTLPLVGNADTRPQPGNGSTQLMFRKLDAGGFSAVSRNSAEDLRDKADYLGIAWTKQHGNKKGLERYEHVRSLALNDAARAFEATKDAGDPFGPAMRESLRRRFQERRDRGEDLLGCTDEHLEGFVYSLTSQCTVHWSAAQPWAEVSGGHS